MRNRLRLSSYFPPLCLAAIFGAFAARPSENVPVGSAASEKAVAAFASRFLPFNSGADVSAARSRDTVPGFKAFQVKSMGRYERLNVDATVQVSGDGKWFFAGDMLVKDSTSRGRSNTGLAWIEKRIRQVLPVTVRAQWNPQGSLGGYSGVTVYAETGYGPVRMPGLLSADGKTFLEGMPWDFHADPRQERRRRMDLSSGPATGPADADVEIVEYADLECGYCRLRGAQLDRLLEANAGIVKARRRYKFFPLWMGHVWAMKAASAGDCISRLAGEAFFRFQKAVYARQESLSLAGIDELAFTFAEAEGVPRSDFVSCYLREESLGRVKKDLEEGYRLGVASTPTYFVNGTKISWLEDKVMEDFLRTLVPGIKTISYEAR